MLDDAIKGLYSTGVVDLEVVTIVSLLPQAEVLLNKNCVTVVWLTTIDNSTTLHHKQRGMS